MAGQNMQENMRGIYKHRSDSRVFCLRPLKKFKKARDKSTASEVVIHSL